MAVYQTRDLVGGIESVGSFEPLQLWAGEMPIITDHGTAKDGTTLAKYAVVARDAQGFLVAHDPAGTAGTASNAIAVGILAQPVAASGANVDVPMFVGGFFNHEALVWNAATDTLAERVAVFAGLQTIRIGRLL